MLPELLASRVVYESPWVNLRVDRIRVRSGRVIERMHVVDVPEPGVASIVEDDAGRVLMVRVPRHATGTCEWELPEGRGDSPTEPPTACAARETLEETGWTTRGHELLHSYHPLPGLSNHVFHVVRCRAVAKVGEPDADEIEDVRWFSLDEIRAMVEKRDVLDGFTLTALFLHLQDR